MRTIGEEQKDLMDEFFVQAYSTVSSVQVHTRAVLSDLVFDAAQRFSADNKSRMERTGMTIAKLADTFINTCL